MIERKTEEKMEDLARESDQSIERSSHLLLLDMRNTPAEYLVDTRADGSRENKPGQMAA